MEAESGRRHIHQTHEFPAFGDNGSAVSPGKNGGKEGRYLLVLWPGEEIRNRQRVICHKIRMFMVLKLLIQKALHGCYVVHGEKSSFVLAKLTDTLQVYLRIICILMETHL